MNLASEDVSSLRVHQVLNNNVVVTVAPSGQERVLTGRGLGFQMRPGSMVDPARIEKTFVLEQGAQGEHDRTLLREASYEVVEAATRGVSAAEVVMGRSLGRRLVVSVIDHLQYLLERLDQGIRIPSAPLSELRILHPDEYRAGQSMAEAISASLKRELPSEEHTFLAMHVINATRDEPGGNTAQLFARVHRVVEVVESGLDGKLDQDGADFARFVLHVKFMAQRVAEGAMLAGGRTAMFEVAVHSYPASYAIAQEVAAMMVSEHDVNLTDEEILYLIVHIERLASVLS